MFATGDEEQVNLEDDKDVRKSGLTLTTYHSLDNMSGLATVDEHLQVVGAETFHKFQKCAINLYELPPDR